MQTPSIARYTILSALISGLCLVISMGGLIACGGAGSGGSDTSLDTPTTRIRTAGSYQMVFDLMQRKGHDDMVKIMGGQSSISGPIGPAQSHYVILTVMSTSERGKTITDATVSFEIDGPGGTSATGGHVLSGKGMHHHALGFAGGEAGEYTVTVNLERGEDRLSETVEFDLPLPAADDSAGHQHDHEHKH